MKQNHEQKALHFPQSQQASILQTSQLCMVKQRWMNAEPKSASGIAIS
jgi:hypothetical protein